MKLLAIETATEACSAAVLCGDDVAERFEIAPRKHNELILSMCEAVLAECGLQLSQLDAITFGCGPGAFTGVRIAAGVTQGIAYAHDLPVVSVSTLANLAQQAVNKNKRITTVLPAIDARMQEIYWALYTPGAGGIVELAGQERVQDPYKSDLESKVVDYGLGSGWQAYKEVLQQKTQLPADRVDATALPRASITIQLGKAGFLQQNFVSAADALPVYLRDNVVHQK